MNKFSIALIISAILFALASIVVPSRVEAQTFQEQLACEDMARFARQVMRHRQTQMPLNRAFNSCTNGTAPSRLSSLPNWRNVCRLIVMEAYRQPDFITEEYQQRSIERFSNEIHLICLEQAMES